MTQCICMPCLIFVHLMLPTPAPPIIFFVKRSGLCENLCFRNNYHYYVIILLPEWDSRSLTMNQSSLKSMGKPKESCCCCRFTVAVTVVTLWVFFFFFIRCCFVVVVVPSFSPFSFCRSLLLLLFLLLLLHPSHFFFCF